MQRKFLTLVENAIVRNTNGGLLVGDVVKFVDGFKTKESFKKLPETVRNAVLELTKKDLNLFVTSIKTKCPSNYPASDLNRGDCFYVEIAQELAPGLLDRQNKVTVSGDLLKADNNYPNLPKIPDSLRRKDKIQHKPVEFGKEENEETINSPHNQTSKTQQGDKLKESETTLHNRNIKIPGTVAKDPQITPIKESYTSMYVPKK